MPVNKSSKDEMSMEAMKAEIEKLRKANASMEKELKKKTLGISFKVSPKGGMSVYGLGRFPVTLYKSQWEQLLERKDDMLEFLEEHVDELKTKDDPKVGVDSDNENSSGKKVLRPKKTTKKSAPVKKRTVSSDDDSDDDSD